MKAFKSVLVIVAAILVAFVAQLAVRHLLTSTPHTAEEFGIEEYVSAHDEDSDEVDDQTDILESARAYVATKPAYKSAYFAGGYPDDGTGVCTDVVAQAFLGAGYDLRTLIDDDIHRAQEAYSIDAPDANIDFRRVVNQRVFFNRHATSLTLDTADISEWQGGDIVAWKNHIGIVSNTRNAQGVPYLIHHGSTLQISYEEDALNSFRWGPITGHWRWMQD